VHLLASRTDCAVVGTLPITEITADRLADTSATVVILEGDDADPATGSAMRVLHGWEAAFALIRVNLSAPTLHVYRCDRPVPAGLDELTGVIRRLADQPGLQAAEDRSIEART
jgi:hypothetical protein